MASMPGGQIMNDLANLLRQELLKVEVPGDQLDWRLMGTRLSAATSGQTWE